MSKEIEKPFRCNVCILSFTNEDHLQVHKRRHEMSLNLSKGNGATNAESFVDETPTPTRFIRNCEEVGLFQDLQNVNPFDEQFVKAASATPSSEAEFDFSFTFRGSTQGVEPQAVEGVSTDSLNTPQVFGFQPTTPLISQSHRTIPSQKDSGTTTVEAGHSSQKLSNEPNSVGSTRQKHVLDLSVSKLEHDRQSNQVELSRKTKRLILATKNKSNLRLNLNQAAEGPTKYAVSDADKTPEDCLESSTEESITEKRAVILERNRAAASRSRERRKWYISALEIKCATLQTKLSQVQADLVATKTENVQLKEELSLHNSCSVSLKRLEDVTFDSPVSKGTVILTSPIICQVQPRLSPRSQDPAIMPVSLDLSLETSTITQVKRGRPKRGFEKRVSDLSFLPIAKSSEPSTKIQILPISAYKKAISTGPNIILLNPGTGS